MNDTELKTWRHIPCQTPEHLAAYAEKLMSHAKEALDRSEKAKSEAEGFVFHAKIAIRSAKAQLQGGSQ